uniref:Uncharacterized protein n=1 Tax=Anthurium amnicola TaxID=1678845 RepID=A0A1D1YL05_9ARAE
MGGKGLVLPAMAGAGDDAGTGDGTQHCSEHPQHSRANPGGICALCLQEKLGRLVSSPSGAKKPASAFADGYPPHYSFDSPSSPPSSSGSIRPTVVEAAAAASGYGRATDAVSPGDARGHSTSRSRMIPFLHSKKKKKAAGSRRVSSTGASSSSLSLVSATTTSSSGSSSGDPVFKRSKSVAPRPVGGFPEGYRGSAGAIREESEMADSPRNKGFFWSFLHLSSHHHRDYHRGAPSTAAHDKTTYIRDIRLLPHPPQLPTITTTPQKAKKDAARRECPPGFATDDAGGEGEEEDSSPGSGSLQASSSAAFTRKVARSRSVGCGSRSFSGDLLERISTGLGDCTLRRVGSQREGKPGAGVVDRELPLRWVRCGGIFRGFATPAGGAAGRGGGDDAATPRARRGWAWALATPMRTFRPSGGHAAAGGSAGRGVSAAAASGTPLLAARG